LGGQGCREKREKMMNNDPSSKDEMLGLPVKPLALRGLVHLIGGKVMPNICLSCQPLN